jgi:hypothetical protein
VRRSIVISDPLQKRRLYFAAQNRNEALVSAENASTFEGRITNFTHLRGSLADKPIDYTTLRAAVIPATLSSEPEPETDRH